MIGANRPQAAVGAGTLALGLGMVAGATQIPGEAGYGGVGPNFLPWVVAAALTLCGGWLLVKALRGGWADMEEAEAPEAPGHWPGFAWLSVGLLANAALITTIGFILSCALCFGLAVRGFRSAEGKLDLGAKAWLRDLAIGFAIAAPVYWLFTKFLAINLPGLTSTGWI